MWISRGIWLNLLQWSSFTINQDWKDIVVKFNILLLSKSLSINVLSDETRERHEIIKGLHDQGYSTNHISNYLNEKRIFSPHGKQYYPKLIWVTLHKMKQREERLKVSSYSVGDFRFYITKTVTLEY